MVFPGTGDGAPRSSGARLLAGAMALLLLAGLATLAAANLPYRGMLWDEAAQFWISQGLSSYAPPFAPRGGLLDVARFNARENLDPGGFSVLLHGWTVPSRGLVWLRLLPFGFFLLGLTGLGALGWRLTRSAPFALASAACLAIYPAACYFGFEIRAYGMEMAGVALGAVALLAALERPSPARALLLGLTCAVFLSSRYSYALVALALLVALCYGIGPRCPRGSRARCCAGALAPILVTGALLAGTILRRQAWPEMRSGPIGVAAPVYTRGEVLRFAGDRGRLVWGNLVSPAALPITLGMLAALVRPRLYRRLGRRAGGVPADEERHVFATLGVLVVSLQAISAAASALGLYPWDIGDRWSAYLLMLSAIAAVALAAEARCLALARFAASPRAPAGRRRARLLGGALATLVVLVASIHATVYRRVVESPHRTDVARQLHLLPVAALSAHSVFVAHFEIPMLRYLYEHGPFAGRPEYPGIFRFETVREWHDGTPIAARQEGIAFVVCALTDAEARGRFPGCVLHRVGPAHSRLLAVICDPGPPPG